MTETAVGLFDQASAAEEVVAALHQKGFPSSGVRVVAAPSSAAVHGTIHEASSDFNTTVTRAFRGIGASEQEAATYLSRLHAGNALVYATGTAEQVREAAELMNDYNAIELEEFVGSAHGKPGRNGAETQTVIAAERTPGVAEPSAEATATRNDPNTTAKIEHHRKRTEGARVFAW